jgi:hypothetical protein
MNCSSRERRHLAGLWRHSAPGKSPAGCRRSQQWNKLAWFSGILVTCLTATGATAAPTNNLSDAEIEGRQLAQQILGQRPVENFANTGILKISNRNAGHTNILVSFKTLITSNSWETVCSAEGGTAEIAIIHKDGQPDIYYNYAESRIDLKPLSDSERNRSFAGSDFWICDLGLEFFHWPQQKILKHEMRRGRSCKVLESTNPDPSPNGYSRVVSWIDNETLGIVQAEAYDAKGVLSQELQKGERSMGTSGNGNPERPDRLAHPAGI